MHVMALLLLAVICAYSSPLTTLYFRAKATILLLEDMKQKIVIQVSMHCDKCRTRALKMAAAADGVISVALHGPEKDKLLILGEGVDAVCLTSSLRKKLSHASLETVEEVKEKKAEDQKKDAGKKDGDKKDEDKKKPKAITPIVWCPCPQPQLEYFTVVADPNPSPCTIL